MSDASIAPRVSAQSELFELVGIVSGRNLVVYLDRFVANTPVVGATIQAEVGGETLAVGQVADGIYLMSADWLARPGEHEIVFTIVAGDDTDLLVGSLAVPSESGAAGTGALSGLGATGWTDRIASFSFTNMAILVLGLLLVTVGFVWTKNRLDPASVSSRPKEAVSRVGRLGAVARLRAVFDRAVAGAKRSLRVGRRASVLMAALAGGGALGLLLVGGEVVAAEPDGGTGTAAYSNDIMALTAGAGNAPRRLLDGSVFMPKPSQRLLDLRTQITELKTVSRTIRVVGEVVPDPGTSSQVQTLIRGRLVQAGEFWPRVGQAVKMGEVLVWVVPVVNPVDRGIIFQHLAQLDQEIVQAQKDLDKLAVQKEKASNQTVDTARAYYQNLNRRRSAIALVLRDRDTLRAPVAAPTDGVISASFAVAGQIAEEQEKLFEVVDPERIWVEASAYDITAVGKVIKASARSSIGRSYELTFLSRGPKLHRQTIPLYFKVENPDGALSVGSLVSVLLETAGSRTGIVLPRLALVRDTRNQRLVWHHTDPERFVPIAVRTEAIDSDSVLVTAGLEPGMRVVVEAADLLNEAR